MTLFVSGSEDNTISGNKKDGIQITGDATNKISATTEADISRNEIGTTTNGTAVLGNQGDGIFISYADKNNIGDVAGDINVISGNVGAGVEISAGTLNKVQNDYIGTDVTGTARIANSFDGVYLHDGSTNNTIGSGAPIKPMSGMNVISGNAWNGIELYNANSNTIAGNEIGTDVLGKTAIGNRQSGIYLSGNASNNTIGALIAQGTPPSNLISGNGQSTVGPNDAGIDIMLASSKNNTIEGNFVGTDISGATAIGSDGNPLGNYGDGILFQAAGTGNSIGLANAPASGNLISGNGRNKIGYGINAFNNILASICFNTVGLDINGNQNDMKGKTLNNQAGWFDGPAPTVENNNRTQ